MILFDCARVPLRASDRLAVAASFLNPTASSRLSRVTRRPAQSSAAQTWCVPVSVVFLVQRSVPLRPPPGALRPFVARGGLGHAKTRRRLIAWVAQSSMQLAQQVRDPLGHGFGDLGSCGEFAGDSCLDFFDDQVLARRLQGFSCTVSTSHRGTRRVDYQTQRKDWTFRSEVGFAVGRPYAARHEGTWNRNFGYAGLERSPPMPVGAAPRVKRASMEQDEHVAVPGFFSRVMARIRGH